MPVVLARSYRGRASLQSGALVFALAPCISAKPLWWLTDAQHRLKLGPLHTSAALRRTHLSQFYHLLLTPGFFSILIALFVPCSSAML